MAWHSVHIFTTVALPAPSGSGSFCVACAKAGDVDDLDNARGVTSAGVTPSAHLMPSSIIVWKCGSSHVVSGCPQPTLNTRPLPYWRAQTTGKSPSGRRARSAALSDSGSSRMITCTLSREYGALNTGCWSLNMNVVLPNDIAPGNAGSSTIILAFALNSLSM